MIKILNSNKRNFNSELNKILSKRKSKIIFGGVSVSSIIKDVKKNGDKALLKYEKKYNKNSNITPTINQVSKSIDDSILHFLILIFDFGIFLQICFKFSIIARSFSNLFTEIIVPIRISSLFNNELSNI